MKASEILKSLGEDWQSREILFGSLDEEFRNQWDCSLVEGLKIFGYSSDEFRFVLRSAVSYAELVEKRENL